MFFLLDLVEWWWINGGLKLGGWVVADFSYGERLLLWLMVEVG